MFVQRRALGRWVGRKQGAGNVGGFSDAVFDVLAAFAQGGLRADHWVGVIEEVSI